MFFCFIRTIRLKFSQKLRTIEAWLQSEGGTPILNLTRMIVVTFRGRNCGFGFS